MSAKPIPTRIQMLQIAMKYERRRIATLQNEAIFFCSEKAFAFKWKRRCKSRRKYFVERIVGASVLSLLRVESSLAVVSFETRNV